MSAENVALLTCGHPAGEASFSRSICPEPCGSMHYYCDTCGEVADHCELLQTEPELGAVDASGGSNRNDIILHLLERGIARGAWKEGVGVVIDHDPRCPARGAASRNVVCLCDLLDQVRVEERKRKYAVLTFRMDRWPQIDVFGPGIKEDCFRAIDRRNLDESTSWIIEMKELPLIEDD